MTDAYSKQEESKAGDPRLRDLVTRCLEELETVGPAGVEALLEQHPDLADRARRRLTTLGAAGMLDGETEREHPDRIGPFRLLEKLGGGGMGVVYRAEQESLGRQVALKIIRPDQLFFSGARERFHREVKAVARLKHPGIVPVYTVGEAGGAPYYAMELVDGCTLGELIEALPHRHPDRLRGEDLAGALKPVTSGESAKAESLSGRSWVDSCLELILQAAEALEHAHGRGVLHRDIKPSNIMVNRSGRVLLVDFGLACTGADDRITRTGSQLGSLAYMAPEQLQGDHEDIDARTDVYSLGVTLYELLTLHSPYLSPNPESTRRRILEGQAPSVRRFTTAVPWDVETVCLTAMEPEANRRYASAADLVRDLNNLLGRRPIEARRAGSILRMRRWIQRHPTWTATIALSVVALIVSTSLAIRNMNLAESESVANQRLQLELRTSEIERARLLARSDGFVVAEDLLWREHLKQPGSAHSYWALWELYQRNPCLRICAEPEANRLRSVAYSPDGALLATGTDGGDVHLWDMETGKTTATFNPGGGPVYSVCFDAEGGRLALGTLNGLVQIWDPDFVEPLQQIESPDRDIHMVRFSPDGSLLASGGDKGFVRLWDTETGEQVFEFSCDGNHIRCVCFDPIRDRLLVGDQAGQVWIFDLETETLERSFKAHPTITTSLAFHPDGEILATGSSAHTFKLWDTEGWRELAFRPTENGTARTLEFTEDGNRILLCGYWRTDVWDVSTPTDPVRVLQRDGGALQAALHPDQEQFVTVTDDRLRIWDVGGKERRKIGDSGANTLKLNLSGDALLCNHVDRVLRLWDCVSWEVLWELPLQRRVASVALDPDDSRAAVGFVEAPFLEIYDIVTGEKLASPDCHRSKLNDVTFSPDRKWIATATVRGVVRIFDARSIELLHTLERSREIHGVQFCADSSLLMATVRGLGFRLWDVPGFEEREAVKTHESPWRGAIHPDGTLLVTGTWAPDVVVHDLRTGTKLKTLIGNHQLPNHTTFSHDGKLIAAGSQAGMVRLWDFESGQMSLALGDSGLSVQGVGFLRGDNAIVVAGDPAGLHLYDLRHYDRHIAGNAEYWIRRLKEEGLPGVNWDEVERWRSGLLQTGAVGPGR